MNVAKIQEVKELNETFYELFGALHENAAHLTTKQVDFMGAKLYELYKGEYAKIVHALELENAREDFTHRERYARMVPRVRRFLWFRRPDLGKYALSRENRAASAILDEIEAETDAFFERTEKLLDLAKERQADQKAEVPENGEKDGDVSSDRARKSPRKREERGKANDDKKRVQT